MERRRAAAQERRRVADDAAPAREHAALLRRVARLEEEDAELELVQAHWSASGFQPWQEPALWDGLARCHEAGLARAVGTSNFGPRQLRKAHKYWRERGGNFTTLPQLFKARGYLTLGVGKIFHPGKASGSDDQLYSWSPSSLPYDDAGTRCPTSPGPDGLGS